MRLMAKTRARQRLLGVFSPGSWGVPRFPNPHRICIGLRPQPSGPYCLVTGFSLAVADSIIRMFAGIATRLAGEQEQGSMGLSVLSTARSATAAITSRFALFLRGHRFFRHRLSRQLSALHGARSPAGNRAGDAGRGGSGSFLTRGSATHLGMELYIKR